MMSCGLWVFLVFLRHFLRVALGRMVGRTGSLSPFSSPLPLVFSVGVPFAGASCRAGGSVGSSAILKILKIYDDFLLLLVGSDIMLGRKPIQTF